MEDRLQVGVISSTHGIRGEVKVFPTTDDPARFKKLKEVMLDTGREIMILHPAGVRFFKNQVIVKFKEFDNINDVEKYRGCSLYVDRANAVPLSEDEYYIADLLGLKVILEDGSDFGVLKDVMETGANDVYIIEVNGGKEVLLPAIRDCVKEINPTEGFMRIHLMPGLME